jgi:hypothetical protein
VAGAMESWYYIDSIVNGVEQFQEITPLIDPSPCSDPTIHHARATTSSGLLATNQHYFSLRSNQPLPIGQQYFSLKTK